jgi:hypothetical protein
MELDVLVFSMYSSHSVSLRRLNVHEFWTFGEASAPAGTTGPFAFAAGTADVPKMHTNNNTFNFVICGDMCNYLMTTCAEARGCEAVFITWRAKSPR